MVLCSPGSPAPLRGRRDGPGRWTAEVKVREGSAASALAASDLFLVLLSRSVRRWPHFLEEEEMLNKEAGAGV